MKHLKMSMMLLLTVAIFTSCEKETFIIENSVIKDQLSSRPDDENDLDGDGILDANDPYPYSNLSEYIYIGKNQLNIDNVFVKPGTTMMDQIDALVSEMNAQYTGDNYAYLHKRFMTKLSAITYYWIKARLITSTQRSKISSAAWGATIPSLPEIGDLRAGGVVFWIDPLDNKHGLVCALSDYPFRVEWGCYGDLPDVPNVFSYPPSGPGAEIGDGITNTNNILNDCPTAPAALAARLLGPEWFLPSINELDEMYKNKATLEAVSGFTPFANYYYWSSTEAGTNGAWGLRRSFNDGGQQNVDIGKGSPISVRAVRAF